MPLTKKLKIKFQSAYYYRLSGNNSGNKAGNRKSKQTLNAYINSELT